MAVLTIDPTVGRSGSHPLDTLTGALRCGPTRDAALIECWPERLPLAVGPVVTTADQVPRPLASYEDLPGCIAGDIHVNSRIVI